MTIRDDSGFGTRVLRRATWVLLVGGALLLAACGHDGMTDAEKKAFVTAFREAGESAQADLAARLPGDEDAQARAFRTELEAIRARLLEEYGLDDAQADAIFIEARKKRWW